MNVQLFLAGYRLAALLSNYLSYDLRKKAKLPEIVPKSIPPGLKARLICLGLCGGVKPPPPSGMSSSAACYALLMEVPEEFFTAY